MTVNTLQTPSSYTGPRSAASYPNYLYMEASGTSSGSAFEADILYLFSAGEVIINNVILTPMHANLPTMVLHFDVIQWG